MWQAGAQFSAVLMPAETAERIVHLPRLKCLGFDMAVGAFKEKAEVQNYHRW
jgi:hypothetical protein